MAGAAPPLASPPPTPPSVAPLQAFYSFAQLAAMWHVKPRTVADWLSILRALDPPAVVCTEKRRQARLKGVTLLAASTAQLLQDRFVLTPKDVTRMRQHRGSARRAALYRSPRRFASAA